MSDIETLGGGTSAEIYRVAVEREKQKTRKGGASVRDQNRRRRVGTPGHTGQVSLFGEDAGRHGVDQNEPFDAFRELVMDVFHDAQQTASAEQHLMYHGPEGVTYARTGEDGFTATVEIGGHRFEAVGGSRYVALANLSAKVAGGPGRAIGPAIEPEPVKTIDLTGQGDTLDSAARHFRKRQRMYSAWKGEAPDGFCALTDEDRKWAAYVGVELDADSDLRQVLADRSVRAVIALSNDEGPRPAQGRGPGR